MSISDIMLDSAAYDASCLQHYADALARHVDVIERVPDFRTECEAELERAQQKITEALEAIRSKRKPMLVAAE